MSGGLCRVFSFLVLLCCCSMSQGSMGGIPVSQGTRDADEVKTIITDVLADSEYRHLRHGGEGDELADDSELPGWLKSFLDWLLKSNGTPSNKKTSVDLRGTLFYGSLSVLIFLLVVLAVLIRKKYGEEDGQSSFHLDANEEAINPSRPAGELSANEYVSRALVAAESGDFRSAIRELVLGAMSWTERGGLIRHRRGLTNRDYIRAVWRDEPRRDSLLRIVGDFERVFYGHRQADQITFDACLTEFQKSFLSEVRDAQPAA